MPTDRNKRSTPKATGYSRPTRASPSQSTRPVIGLGLDLSRNNPNVVPDKRSNSRSRLREIQVTQDTHSVDDDERSIYDDDHNEQEQLWHADRTTDSTDDIHAAHERRREALLGIVSGLALGSDSNDTSLASHQELDGHNTAWVSKDSVGQEGEHPKRPAGFYPLPTASEESSARTERERETTNKQLGVCLHKLHCDRRAPRCPGRTSFTLKKFNRAHFLASSPNTSYL